MSAEVRALNSKPASIIVWDFYDGAYGPSILAVLPDLAAVARLQDIFVHVASSGIATDLAQETGMQVRNMDSLELVRTDPQHGERRTLSRIDNARFRWSCSAHQWHRHAALLDGFVKGHRGHHYLTEEGLDEALIEISYGESHPGMEPKP